MEKTDVAEALEKAADLYESETINWCRRQAFRTASGPHSKVSACALGAISLACGTYVLTDTYVYAAVTSDRVLSDRVLAITVSKVLDEYLGGAGVPHFNDLVAKSKQDVIDAMKNCAKELRNGKESENAV